MTLDLHGYVNADAAAPEHAAAQPQQRVRPLHQARPAGALDIEQGLKDLGYAETHARADPVPRRRRRACGTTSRRSTSRRSRLPDHIPYTIEAPLNPRGGTLTPAERLRRSGINTDVHEVAIKKSLQYIQTNRNQLIFDQAEGFRRGWAGEPQKDIPVGFVPGWGPEDIYKGAPSRARTSSRPVSASAPRRPSERLVDLLIASGGRVTVAKAAVHRRRPLLPGGLVHPRPAPAQRGLVNSLLEPGLDLTDRVDDLYAGPGPGARR